ncbi:unnamed protein product [Amoebophrya sp. A25]|nr:unnamed protein product [Amoebophrya sp. A25]|eukprot:GSA25T00007855001.1
MGVACFWFQCFRFGVCWVRMLEGLLLVFYLALSYCGICLNVIKFINFLASS